MPLFGLGTWKAEPGLVGAAVKHALTNANYKHIDCAAVYANEKEIGVVFNEVFSAGKIKREEIFITSKLWNTEHHPDNVEKACRQTLADLQLEYLDLYLMHWGIAFEPGGEPHPVKDGMVRTQAVTVRETWEAMEKLVAKGLVKAIGVANFTVPMIVDLLTYAQVVPVMNQVELHPYLSQPGLVKYCQAKKIQLTAYSPLGNPGLGSDGPMVLQDPVVAKIAQAHGKTPAQILLNWEIHRGIVVIPKSVKPERIVENSQIFDFELTAAEYAELDGLNRHHRYVNPASGWGVAYFE